MALGLRFFKSVGDAFGVFRGYSDDAGNEVSGQNSVIDCD
jgi:hypothetical protein